MKSLKGTLGIVSAGLLLLCVLPASGAVFSDSLRVFVGGGQVDQRSILEGQEPMLSPAFIDHGLANAASFGSVTILLEAGGNLNDFSTWSDVVGVVDVNGGVGPRSFALGFLSDPLNIGDVFRYFGIGGVINVNSVIQERAGLVVDVTQYVDLANPNYFGYTATFQSDAEVPDGGLTVAFLGFALVGVEGLRRKLKK